MNTTISESKLFPPLPKTKRVFLQTWGCQMNDLDSELMLGKLKAQGWIETQDPRDANLLLYNTCAIREKPVHKVVSMLGDHGRLKETRSDIKIGVLGCVAQLKGEELFKLSPYADFVVGTDHLDKIDEIVADNFQSKEKNIYLDRRDSLDFGRDVTTRPTPFQAYVSVMRGCDLYCTYCVVPTTRGRERSRPAGDILREVTDLVSDGVTEINFLGQTVNAYGRKDKRGTFSELLRSVNEVEGLKRIRFITSHPKWMTDDLIEAMADCEKVMPYLHLPVQSGSNQVLKRMKRLYTREDYLRLIEAMREKIPDISFASDFIVGFSGETDQDFKDTLTLMEEVQYQTAYIFKYSEREGTYAQSKLPDDVPEPVKKERNRQLLELQDKVARRLNQEKVGQTVEVLVERRSASGEGALMGRDPRYLNIALEGSDELIGRYVPCQITEATALTLWATPEKTPVHA